MSRPPNPRKWLLLAAGSVVAALSCGVGFLLPSSVEGDVEAERLRAAYVTSRRCETCHGERTVSWQKTFHRTMTQEMTREVGTGGDGRNAPSRFFGRFDGRPIEAAGASATPRQRSDGRFEIALPISGEGPPTAYEIARTVGSRRLQQFVARLGDRYVRLPVAFSRVEDRWLHLSETFFGSDSEGYSAHVAVWDLNCIFCHNVKANPRRDDRRPADPAGGQPIGPEGRLDSTVAELGIACEACHGPGELHATRMRSPLRRLRFALHDRPDPTIVQPERLEPLRSLQVCGHCHGQRVPAPTVDIRQILAHGDPYTPGEDLSRHFTPVVAATRIGSYSFAPRFWNDGSPRLTAYEYQGVLDSPCFVRGQGARTLTCLACHAQHAGDPHGQLKPELPGNRLCLQCHESTPDDHTRHATNSSGSACVSCHMPTEVYGVLSWHPSHRISSPDPRRAALARKPDACTTCHAGRSRAWAARERERLWPPPVGLGDTASLSEEPEMLRALYAGDVVYRTLAAWRLGGPAHDGEFALSARDRAPAFPEPEIARRALPLLADLLLDAYPNVRRTARNSLEQLTGESGIPHAHDPLAARQAARDRFHPSPGEWPAAQLDRWRAERVEVAVAIGE